MNRELSDDALSLIRNAVADEQRPSSAHRARLRRATLARVATAGAVTFIGTGVAKASGHSLVATILSSMGLGFGAGLIVAGAAHVAFAPKPALPALAAPPPPVAAVAARQQSSTQASEPVALPTAVLPEQAPAPGVVEPRVKERATVTSAPQASANAIPGSLLRAELDLMARVQGALRDKQGAYALELIARYDALHPSGMLETERLAAEVFASCQTGDTVRASSAAARFLERDAVSPLARRVKNACFRAP